MLTLRAACHVIEIHSSQYWLLHIVSHTGHFIIRREISGYFVEIWSDRMKRNSRLFLY
jgi:hypothetical protein